MKKWLIRIFGLLAVLLVIGFVAIQILSAPLPEGTAGADAEALTDKMLAAVNAEAWKSTDLVSWTFAGVHDYVWKRDVDSVQVSWGDMVVNLHTKTVTGTASENGVALTGDDAIDAVADAWAYFCNDSFWLAAPFKVRDPGTTRAIVELENGNDGLLITYQGGGVTPGDSYLWELDAQGIPVAYQMWVSIIPIGGLRATWENYQQLSTGAQVATSHDMKVYNLVLSNIAG